MSECRRRQAQKLQGSETQGLLPWIGPAPDCKVEDLTDPCNSSWFLQQAACHCPGLRRCKTCVGCRGALEASYFHVETGYLRAHTPTPCLSTQPPPCISRAPCCALSAPQNPQGAMTAQKGCRQHAPRRAHIAGCCRVEGAALAVRSESKSATDGGSENARDLWSGCCRVVQHKMRETDV